MNPAEAIARAFHEAYEALAPEHGYETRTDSRKPWESVPENNRLLMEATVQRLLDNGVIYPDAELVANAPGPEQKRMSFADPETTRPHITRVVSELDRAALKRQGRS